jgi:hypothetical protein
MKSTFFSQIFAFLISCSPCISQSVEFAALNNFAKGPQHSFSFIRYSTSYTWIEKMPAVICTISYLRNSDSGSIKYKLISRDMQDQIIADIGNGKPITGQVEIPCPSRILKSLSKLSVSASLGKEHNSVLHALDCDTYHFLVLHPQDAFYAKIMSGYDNKGLHRLTLDIETEILNSIPKSQ